MRQWHNDKATSPQEEGIHWQICLCSPLCLCPLSVAIKRIDIRVNEEPLLFAKKTNWSKASVFCNIRECIIMLWVLLSCLCSAYSGLVIPTHITFNELEKILQQRESVDPVGRRLLQWEIKYCMRCCERHEGRANHWWNDYLEIDNYSHIVICSAYPTTID